MKRHLLISLVSVIAAGAASAATPLPPWYPGPGTTRQGYKFTTNSATPTPEILANPYGAPSASVALGDSNTGWQNPTDPYDLSGVIVADGAGDGAWDLGVAGGFSMVSKFAQAPPPQGSTFSVDFLIYSVAYFGITEMPLLDTLGLVVEDLNFTDSFVAEDPNSPLGVWQGRTWTGTFKGLTTDQISLLIKAPSNNIAVLDTVEVFTRMIFEPGGLPADGDPDGDGLSNLMEFALDADPLVGNPSPLQYDFHSLSDGKHLRLTVPKNPEATNLDYIVETSSNLTAWSTLETFIESDTTSELIVRDTLTTASAPKRFIRLRVRVNY
jgi:hypothetical protein